MPRLLCIFESAMLPLDLTSLVSPVDLPLIWHLIQIWPCCEGYSHLLWFLNNYFELNSWQEWIQVI